MPPVARSAFVAEIHLSRRLLPSFGIFLWERPVARKLSQEAALAFRILPSCAALCFFYSVLSVLPAEIAVSPLRFGYYHFESLGIVIFVTTGVSKSSLLSNIKILYPVSTIFVCII